MRRKNCHYSLADLTEHRCPECSRDFDPNDPTTFDSSANRDAMAVRNERVLRNILWVALAALLAALAAVVVLAWRDGIDLPF